MDKHLNFLNLHDTWHIFLPQDRKTIKKDSKILFFADGGSLNFRLFQQPIRSCGIVLTANQRCGQNLAAVSTNF